jgi:hypothetical protein
MSRAWRKTHRAEKDTGHAVRFQCCRGRRGESADEYRGVYRRSGRSGEEEDSRASGGLKEYVAWRKKMSRAWSALARVCDRSCIRVTTKPH